jgi:hypothetical protein
MLAMVGDNRNARQDPEVIAPSSMIASIVRDELETAGRGQGGGISSSDMASISAAVERGMVRGFKGIRQQDRAA